MDDILVVRNDLKFVQTIKRWLSSTFEMKDMRKKSYILEVKIHRDRSNKLIVFFHKNTILRKSLNDLIWKIANSLTIHLQEMKT